MYCTVCNLLGLSRVKDQYLCLDKTQCMANSKSKMTRHIIANIFATLQMVSHSESEGTDGGMKITRGP